MAVVTPIVGTETAPLQDPFQRARGSAATRSRSLEVEVEKRVETFFSSTMEMITRQAGEMAFLRGEIETLKAAQLEERRVSALEKKALAAEVAALRDRVMTLESNTSLWAQQRDLTTMGGRLGSIEARFSTHAHTYVSGSEGSSDFGYHDRYSRTSGPV